MLNDKKLYSGKSYIIFQIIIGTVLFIISLFDISDSHFFLFYSIEKFFLLFLHLILILFLGLISFKNTILVNRINSFFVFIKSHPIFSLIFSLTSISIVFSCFWIFSYKNLLSYWYYLENIFTFLLWIISFLLTITAKIIIFNIKKLIEKKLSVFDLNFLYTLLILISIYIIFGNTNLYLNKNLIYTTESPFILIPTFIYIFIITTLISISQSINPIKKSKTSSIILIITLITLILIGQYLNYSESDFLVWENAIKYFNYKPLLYMIFTVSSTLFALFYYISLSKIKIDKKAEKQSLFIFLIGITSFITFFSLVKFFGFIQNPDIKFWNGAGNPIFFYQLCIAILVLLSFYLFLISYRNKFIKKRLFWMILIIITLIIIAFLSWQWEPDHRHYFFTKSTLPNFERYPYSDSQDTDFNGQYLLNGRNIINGELTVNSLHIFITYLYHLIGGQDYYLISTIQMIIMLFLPIGIFLLGKALDYPQIGFLAAILVIFQEANAITLSGVISNVHIQTLMSEIPTLLFIVWGTYFFIKFIKNEKIIDGIISGTIIGLSMLLRLNPGFIFGAFLIFLLFEKFLLKKPWEKISAFFIPGFSILMISQYIVYKITGSFGLFTKIYHVLIRTISFKPTIFKTKASLISHSSLVINETINTVYALINHFLNNLFTSFMVLPMNFNWHDQSLFFEFWDPITKWSGDVSPYQFIIIIINFIIIVLGFWNLWKKNKITSLIPLLVLIFYALSLGIARTSGGRYLTPFNWVIVFYYASGIWELLTFLIPPIKDISFLPFESKIEWPLGKTTVLFLSLTIFVSMIILPPLLPDYTVRPESELIKIMQQVYQSQAIETSQLENILNSDENIIITEGIALYPIISENGELSGRLIHDYLTIITSPESIHSHNFTLPHDTNIICIGIPNENTFRILEYAYLDTENQWQYFSFNQ